MIDFSLIHEIQQGIFEFKLSARQGMRVPARIYASQRMLEAIIADKSLEQLANVATLPGIKRYALAMPDIHQGYGFPVGGIAALSAKSGVISPGGIGYDINCGVRLLTSELRASEIRDSLPELCSEIQQVVPSGVGRCGGLKLANIELDQVLNSGMKWCLSSGFASDDDLEATEENGCFSGARSEYISDEAKTRGHDQLGTIGSGNHFVEIQKVGTILDPDTAAVFGLFADQVCVMIHTGSRGLGHQTCTDYVRKMNETISGYDFKLPDRELACAPFESNEGQQYFGAMQAAANFAWANRQLITFRIREVFKRRLGLKNLPLLYDVSHNIAKLENYDGEDCVVHRKGATRAFGPNLKQIPEAYRSLGQPVLIPGSMGTASYVLCGTTQAMESSFGSCCHGAGRAMSRMKAKKTLDYNQLLNSLNDKDIIVKAGSARGLLEEAPQAYKDIEQVISVVAETKIAKPVARLLPLAVIKG